MKRTGTTNPHLKDLILRLKRTASEKNVPLWRRVALDLSRSTRIRRQVNLSRINRFTKKGDLVIVPGKILGSGKLEHSLTIAAWRISEQAKEKVQLAQGTYLTIDELLASNPTAKKIKIIG